MRYVSIELNGKPALGVRNGQGDIDVVGNESLETLLANGTDLAAWGKGRPVQQTVKQAHARFLPPLTRPTKIICVGLNYADHTAESPYEQPDYPTLFLRLHTSLVAHNQPIVRSKLSDSLDYEGEVAVVLGKGGRYISKDKALECVAGYSIFNDGSIREYQFIAPQWTVGKNFYGTGGFGPDLVTADELPAGAKGLKIETRLNGEVVQSGNTSDMIFDVATLISIISEAITLEAGDVIVSGTPAGIGWARDPKLLMRGGDVCEVTVEKLGTLRNPIVDEA
ncbi:MAG TPA: fumarylacetoacetate hydrolase family protein [Pusillimonas sp.]|uniref:fumarylacetoacetate hydrolase family protein n=1 Tax=Pusillimonas sp. TaxID=3040095 RepID=UPI002BB9D194|nr:fumarylacetoacetate hydrolase family protein [Pusillimonas sp.]HUH87006.1 fumarylacetoacetate hydrolase family protein [Pusillimonas sp.]